MTLVIRLHRIWKNHKVQPLTNQMLKDKIEGKKSDYTKG